VIAGLLLAAGGARRFGSQKLLAPLGGSPLVRRAAATLATETDQLWVVVGSEAAAVRRALDGLPACFVENEQWAEGLSSSLAAGIRALPQGFDAIVIGLGDQPSVDREVIRRVIDRWRETAPSDRLGAISRSSRPPGAPGERGVWRSVERARRRRRS
jgi:molybdenum cofactor cytidylyltransferase